MSGLIKSEPQPKRHWLAGLVKGVPEPGRVEPTQVQESDAQDMSLRPTGSLTEEIDKESDSIKTSSIKPKAIRRPQLPAERTEFAQHVDTNVEELEGQAPEVIETRATIEIRKSEPELRVPAQALERPDSSEGTLEVDVRDIKVEPEIDETVEVKALITKARLHEALDTEVKARAIQKREAPPTKPNNEWVRVSGADRRERLIMFKGLAVMMEAGIPILACFEFLVRQSASPVLADACRRTSQGLASGKSLPALADNEPVLFPPGSARMLEAGMKSGKLVAVLRQLTDDEEESWRLRQKIQSELLYPFVMASLALGAAVLLPPLALSGVLEQVVALTEEPPAISLALLKFSAALSSPSLWLVVGLCVAAVSSVLSRPSLRQKLITKLEPSCWKVPFVGRLLQVASSIRFLQSFSLMYEVGLPVQQCLILASQGTGSVVVSALGVGMKERLMSGETLADSIRFANFLPRLACESIEAGEHVGKIPVMMSKAADLLSAELEYRIEIVLSVLEPAMLGLLGMFVGIFALGCLLPIIKLAETL